MIPVHPEIPHSMNRFARNRRLFDFLFGLGPYVDAVLIDDDPDKIDSIVVSVDPRTVSLLPTRVDAPAEGTEVSDVVTPTHGNRDNVVDFPTVVRVPVTIRRE